MNISPTVTKRRFARLPPVVTNGLIRGGLVVLLVVAASYAGWVLATAKATDDVVTKGLGAARALLQGSTAVQQVPVTPEGYAEVAKFRQEVFCKDSGSMDIKPQGRITILKDPYNTTVLQIHPLPAYMCVYGGAQDIVSQAIIAGHVWESHDLDEISWALQVPLPEGAAPTSTIGPALVVDIGANLGAFTFNLAAQGYEVIAFEGMNANQRMMRTCLCASHPSIMSRVTLHAMGLGARKSTCYLIAANDNRGDGIALCNAKDEQDALKQIGNPSYALRGTMDIEKLDNVLKRDVKVMKIDVEGFEPFVMAGAERLLTDHTVWFLVVEYNKVLLSNSLKGQTEIQRVDFVLRLARLGYRISSKSFKGPFMTEEQIVDMDHMVGPHLLNLYFVHKRVALPHS